MKNFLLIPALCCFLFVSLAAQNQKVTVQIEGLACPFCAYGLEKKFLEVKSVSKLSIDVNQGEMTFTLNDANALTEKEIRKKIKDAGFKTKKISFSVLQEGKSKNPD
jgi:mercuric ion binding protein